MSELSGRPTSADKRQIVQIAAIRFLVNDSTEVASFDQLVIPVFEPRVAPFFETLTGITQAEINQYGIPFIEAAEQFRQFCQDTPIWTFDKDQEVFEQNYGYVGIRSPFTQDFVRVKALLPNLGIDPDAYSSGTLYKAAGLKMEGHVHNALHDVRSMAAAIAVLERRQF